MAHKNPRLLWGTPSPRLLAVEPVRQRAKPPHLRQARVFSLLALILGLAYLIWLGRLVVTTRESPDIFFFIAESLSYLLLCLLSFSTWHPRRHHPENPGNPVHFPVDVFVPCCGEPLQVIKTTLQAVRQINYYPLEVYILDDGGSQAVADLAYSWGFHYLSRPGKVYPARIMRPLMSKSFWGLPFPDASNSS